MRFVKKNPSKKTEASKNGVFIEMEFYIVFSFNEIFSVTKPL
ncbi:hypothetical protein JOD96_001447 [Flavobacterium sp. 1355]|nr:hypothetical protein [Flavobacterium sp. 1355]